MDILTVENVSKAYSSHLALDNVSLSVPEGQVYGLLGPNGAGKTTLIRIINHITAPDSGRVLLDGHQLTEADVCHIGYLPEERGLYKKMKVGEQALFFARLKGLSKQDAVVRLREWFERFDILSWWDKKVEELSKGMAQKVQFIITVLHRPKLLIFDEPFSGFDPINAELLKNEILRLKDEGSTVIFSTHNMGSVEEICDNITLINKSRNILSGNVEEIRRQYFGNRYDLLFEGDGRRLMENLMAVGSEFEMSAADSASGRQSLTFHLNEDARLHDAIAIANETVSLAGINESLASMNEIFIKAVKEDESRR
ncbi:MAG: ATP-binding cassette domain-containing protein [Duncaniella sp.]|uniref:ABC transporter ATP-binding protein n=1 Tax=Duncaniella sp. TaxID=2518496 RepID=UPI0023CCE919|nr:ATP-binding cassette domain-containing protein [Duncaniella sp.]MDE5989268.1 ATP-binding cassette domain-containing protein [Duncaniella sp.]MDE6175330.1 ATP-binding cassette domain-containing protein [Duncaniella sp.]